MKITLRSEARLFSKYWWKHWLDVTQHARVLTWYYQRATRGWADCDVWGLSDHLCEIMIPMLKRLRENKPGVPVPADAVFIDDCGNTTDEEWTRWQTEWNNGLDTMIAGFEAAAAVCDGPPDAFFPPMTAAEMVAEDVEQSKREQELGYAPGTIFRSRTHYLREEHDKWSVEQEAIRDKGFDAFKKHFYSLWD